MTRKEYEAEKLRLNRAIEIANKDLTYFVSHLRSEITERYIAKDFMLSVRSLLVMSNFILDRIGLEEAWEEHKLISSDQEEEAEA